MMKYQNVIGYTFVSSSMNEFVELVHQNIVLSKKTFIITANPEIVTYANTNSLYRTILNRSDYIIPDGVGIILASKLLGRPLHQRLTGFDLMDRLLMLANKKGYRVYLLGTKPHYINLTADNISKKYPRINIVGYHHGYFHESDTIINNIKEVNPDIVFVGLGFPKQEFWIDENLSTFTKGIFIGVGGCFNVWAGVTKRAPKIWRDTNLEWLYRILKEPSRLKRAMALPLFVIDVLRIRYNEKKNIF